jgi:hypothetical protein
MGDIQEHNKRVQICDGGVLCQQNLGFLGLSRLAKPLTGEEGLKILERDRYRCQYCGLDGLTSFENSLIMSVDFIQPRARKGKKEAGNLVTACRPCNRIKGSRVFANFEAAKKGSGANSSQRRGWLGLSVLSVRDGLTRRAPHSTVPTCSAWNSQTCRS